MQKPSTVEVVAFLLGTCGGAVLGRGPMLPATKPEWVQESEDRIKKESVDHNERWGHHHPVPFE